MTDLNKIVEDLSSLTVLEAAELSKLLEDKWGVSAAAPVAVAAAPTAGGDAPAEEATVAEEHEEDEDDELWVQFVQIVDDLLGDHLPAEIVEAFVGSSDFDVYRSVNEAPTETDDETRSEFYKMVDDQLGNMSSDAISAFVNSDEFEIYRYIGERYKDE